MDFSFQYIEVIICNFKLVKNRIYNRVLYEFFKLLDRIFEILLLQNDFSSSQAVLFIKLKRFKWLFSTNFILTKAGFYHCIGNLDYSQKFRTLALEKETGFTSTEIIQRVMNKNVNHLVDYKYVDLGGLDNLGFIIAKDLITGKFVIGKIYITRKAKKEEIFYSRIKNNISNSKNCISNYIFIIKIDSLNVVFFEYFGTEMKPTFNELYSVISSISILETFSYGRTKSYLTSSEIDMFSNPFHFFHKRNSMKLLLLYIKRNLTISGLYRTHKELYLNLYKIILLEKAYLKINPDEDYVFSHGDYSCGSDSGWGNKTIANGEVMLFDFSDSHFTLRGLSVLRLLRTKLDSSIILEKYLYSNDLYFENIKYDLKIILVGYLIYDLTCSLVKFDSKNEVSKDLDYLLIFVNDYLEKRRLGG